MEQTFVLIKPDGYERKLVGEIISRFEKCGLVIEEMRVVQASRELAARHYPNDEQWLTIVGNKSLQDYAEKGIDPKEAIGTSDPVEIGRQVKSWLVDYLSAGPVVAIVLSGSRAVEVVRKLIGSTLPVSAAPGTIRGDYSTDSPALANEEQRAVINLIHASGAVSEAEEEIALWFPERFRRDESLD